jgi:FMN-dependent NADH-azoreductase
MPTLLNIQSSPRGGNSISRTLSQDFVTAWQTKHPDGKVVLRDLAENNLPYVGIPWITGIFLPADKHTPEMQQALAVSDELITELFAADEILIGTPMYNFTVPANLKAWIDLIVRPRVTHSGPPERKGLVIGKTCKIIIASGGTYDEGRPAAASDHESGYLKRILAFIGITEIEVILAGGTAAVAFGSTTVEELAAQFRPAVLAATRTRKATLSAPESVARKPAH